MLVSTRKLAEAEPLIRRALAIDEASAGPNHASVADLCDDSTGCQVSILIEADFSNTIAECDGTDNTRCASPIGVNIPDIAVSADSLTGL